MRLFMIQDFYRTKLHWQRALRLSFARAQAPIAQFLRFVTRLFTFLLHNIARNAVHMHNSFVETCILIHIIKCSMRLHRSVCREPPKRDSPEVLLPHTLSFLQLYMMEYNVSFTSP